MAQKSQEISPQEAGDRLAIRELVDAYADCADRRNAPGQMALFAKEAHFVVYMDAKSSTPSMELHSREELAPVFADLHQYNATMHFIGQSWIETLEPNHATGQTYCIAHHLKQDGDKQSVMVAYLHYRDRFEKLDGEWLFSERLLYVDWIENRVA